MKDIVISGRRIARELLIFLGCFVAALVVNAYAIAHFNTEWKELFTTLHITLAVSLVFFALLALLRALIFWCARISKRRPA